MSWLTACAGLMAPLFIVFSPLLSYGDQALAMHRKKSSAGFSLDIPLIMIVASLLRIFYWPGAHFDASLLAQALIMVAMQMLLLKIALDHRPAPSTRGGDDSVPFSGVRGESRSFPRPYNFWQWRSPKPYWNFLLYFSAGLTLCELLLSPMRSLYSLYSVMIGYIGLSVEAVLPIPQIIANSQSKSCRGFRLSVLASWLVGDALKMLWFFTTAADIPRAFKYCALFQACCDCLLAAQYLAYGEGAAGFTVAGQTGAHLDDARWSSAYKAEMFSGRKSVTPTMRSAGYYDIEVDNR